MCVGLGAKLNLNLGRILTIGLEILILIGLGQSLGFLLVLGVGLGRQHLLCLRLYLSRGRKTHDKKNRHISV